MRTPLHSAALTAAILASMPALTAPQPLLGQTPVVLLDETFDDDGGFAKFDSTGTSTSFFSDGTDSYFGLSDGAGGGDFDGDPIPSGAEAYGNADGTFLGTETVAGGGPTSYTLEWNDVDISGYSDLQVSLEIASIGNSSGGPPGPFEPGDFLLVAMAVDGGYFEPLLDFRSNGNGYLESDTDGDGIGDSDLVTGLFVENAPSYLSVIPEGSTLDLRITFSSDAATEDIAIDNVRVSGTPPPIFVDGFESGDTTAWSATVP